MKGDEKMYVKGICTEVKSDYLWVRCEDNLSRLFYLSDINIIKGGSVKGASVHFDIDPDDYEGAIAEYDPNEKARGTQPAPANPLPAKVLERLMSLCDPEKHKDNTEDYENAFVASRWLECVKEAQYGVVN